MLDRADCVELGLTCADVCQALGRADQPSRPVFEAIEQLATWVEPVTHIPACNLLNDISVAGP